MLSQFSSSIFSSWASKVGNVAEYELLKSFTELDDSSDDDDDDGVIVEIPFTKSSTTVEEKVDSNSSSNNRNNINSLSKFLLKSI